VRYSTSGQSGGVELSDDKAVLDKSRVGSFSHAKTSTPVLDSGPLPSRRKDSVAVAILEGVLRTVELSTRTLVVMPRAGWSFWCTVSYV
jgi:hypothetical protein